MFPAGWIHISHPDVLKQDNLLGRPCDRRIHSGHHESFRCVGPIRILPELGMGFRDIRGWRTDGPLGDLEDEEGSYLLTEVLVLMVISNLQVLVRNRGGLQTHAIRRMEKGGRRNAQL